jgi:4-carboxymuconolactone decarboxylase
MVTHAGGALRIVPALDSEERELVRLAAAIAVADEDGVRAQIARAASAIRPEWVEEVILQSYLFAGFPRALNAAREWRRLSARPAPPADDGEQYDRVDAWRAAGEETCAVVYGAFYERLRHNIRQLHPALDAWMVVEGYGKVLSRPGLELRLRELCIVAVCAVARQDRQLHSHLHGALHAGASAAAVSETLAAVAERLSANDQTRYALLWERVQASAHVH